MSSCRITKASLLSDQQFLQDAKDISVISPHVWGFLSEVQQEKCAAHEAEYADRVAARNEEITGCSKAWTVDVASPQHPTHFCKAIVMLSDDSARDTFSPRLIPNFLDGSPSLNAWFCSVGRTFNAGAMFLQVDASKEHRVAASETLTEAAAKSHDSRFWPRRSWLGDTTILLFRDPNALSEASGTGEDGAHRLAGCGQEGICGKRTLQDFEQASCCRKSISWWPS